MSVNIKELVKNLTLEEKAGLTSGKDGWYTKAVERLNIPNIRVSDGPHGLRVIYEEDLNLLEGRATPAVCFPAACTTASGFDTEAMYKMGEELAEECKALNVDVVLGPGVNMKRSPLCGRNFEYFSEDPQVAGKMGAAFVNGVQSKGIGTSLKHFFANSQEHRRMSSSSNLDERTMREIYLPAFEYVVKHAQPWTIMAAYNKINGTFCTENKYLEDLLRKEWGFKGLVVSDWGATHNRVKAVEAGCDLTMPAEDTDRKIVEAVKNGTLSESALDKCCERILELTYRCIANRKKTTFNYEKGHDLAREIAGGSMVLLKNDGILPLSKKVKAAYIGEFAREPRIQGGGSSHINCNKIVGAVEAAEKAGIKAVYSQGYNSNGSTTEELIAEAVKAAKAAEVAVIFAGLPDDMETEGVDRGHMRMPEGHNKLISEVCKVQPNTVVVLHNGSPVEIPWVNQPKAILEAYLGGEACGEAVVDILYGDVNPSGRLAETFPVRLEDNPSYLSYLGEGNNVDYQEGIYIGYRYYVTKKMPVLFPFGHGLSYTTFTYDNLTVDKNAFDENEKLTVSVTVKNTGKRTGKEVVQVYVAPADKMEIKRPIRELKAFEKVELKPGESKTVSFELDRRAFAHWNTIKHGWRVESGKYDIQVCKNAEEVILSEQVTVNAEPLVLDGFNMAMTMKDLASAPEGYKFLNENICYMIRGMAQMGYVPKEILAVAEQLPGGLTLDTINMLAGRSGMTKGGSGGLETLLAQSLTVFTAFLPSEKRDELEKMIDKLNEDYGI